MLPLPAHAMSASMTFNDLKLGMRFMLFNQDNPIEYTICKILGITNKGNYILVDFDDLNKTTVYGKLNEPIYKFMKFLTV